jgi:hypothetical protein
MEMRVTKARSCETAPQIQNARLWPNQRLKLGRCARCQNLVLPNRHSFSNAIVQSFKNDTVA